MLLTTLWTNNPTCATPVSFSPPHHALYCNSRHQYCSNSSRLLQATVISHAVIKKTAWCADTEATHPPTYHYYLFKNTASVWRYICRMSFAPARLLMIWCSTWLILSLSILQLACGLLPYSCFIFVNAGELLTLGRTRVVRLFRSSLIFKYNDDNHYQRVAQQFTVLSYYNVGCHSGYSKETTVLQCCICCHIDMVNCASRYTMFQKCSYTQSPKTH